MNKLGSLNSGNLPNFSLFKGDALNLEYSSYRINNWRQFIPTGEEYYLFIKSSGDRFQNDIQIITTTDEVAISNNIASPDTILCGNILCFDFNQTVPNNQCNQFYTDYRFYMTLLGKGQYVSFYNLPDNTDLFITDDDPDKCGWYPGTTFFFEDSVQYGLTLSSTSYQIVVDSIEVVCIEPQPSFNCNEPIVISCGDHNSR